MKPLSVLSVLMIAGLAQAQPAQLSPLSEGAMKKMGGYRPQRVTLSAEKPASITKLPEGLSAPKFGVLAVGPAAEKDKKPAQIFHIVVDEPQGEPAKLFVDANGNGDLTDDPAAEWKGTERTIDAPKKEGDPADKEKAEGEPKEKPQIKVTQYNGGATLDIHYPDAKFPAHLGMYRFDPSDPSRAALKNVLLYYSDYAVEGKIKLGDKEYKTLLVDDNATGDFRGQEIKVNKNKDGDEVRTSSGIRLLVDANGNGKFDSRGEAFDVREPFNIGGTTYEVADLSPSGQHFNIVKSDKKVAEVATPPDHSVGKKVTAFAAKDTAGKPVNFPGDFKGKIVMIDFWATWCGPCMEEVPNLVKIYKEMHPKGFEVLGITLDQKDALDKVNEVTKDKGMSWRQVYDGKGWKAEIAQLYVINSIPAAILVDGDTGEILANDGLRGAGLKAAIEKALTKKHGDGKS